MSEDVVELSDDNFESVVKGSRMLVVDCWAPWCGPCRMLAPTFEALAKDYKDKATFGKLDTDKSMRTATALGINSIPTLIFFREGQQVARVTGVRPRADIESVLKAHLQ